MISVIVPIYNVSEYLPQCIDSIIAQTYKDLEIILVDDGSTDSSAQICDKYKERDSRIVVVHKENGGLVSARKAGVACARGSYIAYVDGDDWIEPNMYGRLYDCIVSQNVDVAMCGRFEDSGSFSKAVYHGMEQGRYDKRRMAMQIYPRMLIGGDFFEWGIFPGLWDKLFRRESIEAFQMEVDERIMMGEDAACTYPCLLYADSIYVLHECLYHYRQTQASMTKLAKEQREEREQFGVLYRTVRDAFALHKGVYDLKEQWEAYMLFLMVPRADGLYEGFGELDYLFPFPKVKKGARIALYGAGTYGQRLFAYLKRSKFCEVVIWVDRNHMEFSKAGLEVAAPEDIESDAVDQIVLAICFAKPRDMLYKQLVSKFGEEKISMLDESVVFSPASKKAFRIGE